MSRKNSAQVSVVALIGERNREVKAFLEHELGPEGMKRSVVVVRHFRPSRAAAHSRGICRAGRGRIFSRSGRGRSAGDGFGYAPRHGAARNRPGRGRAAQPEGIHAVGLHSAAEDLRARRQFRKRIHHRILHRPGGRRRFQRADLRRRARHPGRAPDSVAGPGFVRALSGHRRSLFQSAVWRRRSRRAEETQAAQKIREALALYQQSAGSDPARRARPGR